ncbi:unnamed protein product [Knipowitschia caucasica]|uniref:Uncharacterized protein n=1 Tax=Knipowitschia caucasica TaxID=637954 RepID=A0AAV2M5D9_KNICA
MSAELFSVGFDPGAGTRRHGDLDTRTQRHGDTETRAPSRADRPTAILRARPPSSLWVWSPGNTGLSWTRPTDTTHGHDPRTRPGRQPRAAERDQ